MRAFVEERPSGRWLVVLSECGELIYTRRVESGSKAQGVLSPIVSKEQYDTDRQKALLATAREGAGSEQGAEVVPLPRRPESAPASTPVASNKK